VAFGRLYPYKQFPLSDGLVDPQSNYGILSSNDTQTWKRQIAANAVFSSRQPQKTDYEYEHNGVDHFFMFCFQIKVKYFNAVRSPAKTKPCKNEGRI